MIQEREGEGVRTTKNSHFFIGVCLDVRDVIISEGRRKNQIMTAGNPSISIIVRCKRLDLWEKQGFHQIIAFNVEIVRNQGFRKTGIHYKN